MEVHRTGILVGWTSKSVEFGFFGSWTQWQSRAGNAFAGRDWGGSTATDLEVHRTGTELGDGLAGPSSGLELGSDRVDGVSLSLLGAELIGCSHGFEHRVVDIESLGVDVEDLARLESTAGSADGVEDST